MENTTPWLTGGVSQHLSNQGRDHLCKVRRENCSSSKAFDFKCVQNLQHWLKRTETSR
jgi:hypothetical protein